MSKFCKSCGSANTDNAIQCSRCGKPLANGGDHTAKGNYAQNIKLSNGAIGNTYRRPNYSVPPQQGRSSQTYYISPKQGRASQTYSTPLQPTNSNVSSTQNKGNSGKNGAFSFIGIIAFIAIVFFVGKMILGNTKPNESWLKENMPAELLNYVYKEKECHSSVEDIEIIRRNTEKNSDDAYCKVTLRDERLERIVYVEFISTKYEQGGWHLEAWNEYEPEETTPLIGMTQEEAIVYVQKNAGFENVSNFVDNSDLGAGWFSYSFDVNEKYKYMDTFGTVSINGEFRLSTNDDPYVFPREYWWETEIDISSVKNKWKLDGIYACTADHESGGEESFEVAIETEDNVMIWDYTADELHGDEIIGYSREKHHGDGSQGYEDSEVSPADSKLEIRLCEGYAVYFYKDSVVLKCYRWNTAFSSENEMRKKD